MRTRYPKSALIFGALAAMLPLTPSRADDRANPSFSGALIVQAEIPLSGEFIGYGFGSVWMMNGHHLARLDPKDNSFVEVKLNGYGGPERGIAVGEGAIWIPDVHTDIVYKIDPASNSVVKEIPVQMLSGEGSIGVGEGSIWIVSEEKEDRTLVRFNAQTGEVEAKILLPSRGAGVVVDYGAVWVAGNTANELYRIDPKLNAVAAIIPTHERPYYLTSGENSIWVLNQGDRSVQRVDGHTGQMIATIELGASDSPWDLTFGGGFVWVTAPNAPLVQIDPKTNQLGGKFRMPMNLNWNAVRYAAGSLWVSSAYLYRVQPLR